MMEIAASVAQQVCIMLVIILIGFVLYKFKLIDEQGSKSITSILTSVVTPCVLVSAYQIDYNNDILTDIIVSFGISFLLHAVFILISYIIYGFRENGEKRKNHLYASIYSNCGFFGIPLLSASLGQKGVLFGSAYLVTMNILCWTHGIFIYSGDRKILSVKRIIKNPGVMGSIIAMILFFAHIKVGGAVKSVIGYMSSLNTPLAMLLIGTYLAKTDLLKAFKNKGIYKVVLIRLVLLPVISVLLMKLFKVQPIIASALAISASCPCSALSAIFADMFGYDSGYSSQIVSITTILSVISIPAMVYLTALIIG